MVKKISPALAELINLINTANWHRDGCMNNCSVSLYMLGMTAKRLVNHCWMSERNEARRLIAETKWS